MNQKEVETCVRFLMDHNLIYIIRNWLKVRWYMLKYPDYRSMVENGL